MDTDARKEIETTLENYSIGEILDIYLEENCYSEVVDHLVAHLNKRLSRVDKIYAAVERLNELMKE